MRVLVVEDDVRVAAAIRRGLRSVNAVGDVANTSSSACTLLADTPYDVIVLVVKLPDADGFVTCPRLRSAGNWTPIIMLTGRAGNDDRIRGLDAGADDYLTKPFAFGELLIRLRALARRDPPDRSAIITVGSLRLDPASAQVWRGEQEIRLSGREFALLEAFMRSPGQVLGHNQLLDAAWDIGHEYRSNVIEVYIRYSERRLTARSAYGRWRPYAVSVTASDLTAADEASGPGIEPGIRSSRLSPRCRGGRMDAEMRLPTLLRKRGTPTEIGGVVRLDRRTKSLTKRLAPGEIAIIHHSDLDRVSAEALVEAGAAAVVNAVSSVSGRYPNLGPGILLEAGIPLIDNVGDQVFSASTRATG
jgi:two-component system OmpR family response regulator